MASKATGFPIAKIAAKLAVGYTLDEITNDITGVTKASFEPTIDYVVVKIPRFAFQKFPGADPTLTTQMKSVGEVMAIGRTFKEALAEGDPLAGSRTDTGSSSRQGLDRGIPRGSRSEEALEQVRTTHCAPRLPDRLWHLADGMRLGMTNDDLLALTKIDPWFLEQIRELIEFEQLLARPGGKEDQLRLSRALLWEAKELGFSDDRIAQLTGVTSVRSVRQTADPGRARVDAG